MVSQSLDVPQKKFRVTCLLWLHHHLTQFESSHCRAPSFKSELSGCSVPLATSGHQPSLLHWNFSKYSSNSFRISFGHLQLLVTRTVPSDQQRGFQSCCPRCRLQTNLNFCFLTKSKFEIPPLEILASFHVRNQKDQLPKEPYIKGALQLQT